MRISLLVAALLQCRADNVCQGETRATGGPEVAVADEVASLLQVARPLRQEVTAALLGEGEGRALDDTPPPIGAANASSRCSKVGARAWVTQRGLDYAGTELKKVVTAELLNKATSSISPTSGNIFLVGDYSFNNFTVMSANVTDTKLGFLDGQGLDIQVQGIQLAIKADFKFESWLIHGRGTVVITTNSPASSASLSVAVDVTPMGAPELKALKVSVATGDLKSTFAVTSGSLSAWLLNSLSGLITSFMAPVLKKQAEDALTQMVNVDLNNMLSSQSFELPVPMPAPAGNLTIDLGLCRVRTSKDYMAVDIRGLISDVTRPSLLYPVQPIPLPEVPPKGLDNSMVAVSVTKWIVNSGLWIFHQAGLFKNYSVGPEQIPANPLFSMTTKAWGHAVPAWKSRWYWSRDITVSSFVLEPPTVNLSHGKFAINANTRYVVNTTDLKNRSDFSVFAFSLKSPLKAEVSFGVTNMTAGPQNITINLENLQLNFNLEKSAVGLVAVPLINPLLSWISSGVIVPMINSALAEGIPVASTNGIDLTNVAVGITDTMNFYADSKADLSAFITSRFGAAVATAVSATPMVATAVVAPSP
eukprot:CAMPEP_0204147826 /NCGR_PEP_ID=MMETSP0361-20130328/23071_1 /ASSEMBLY_ACC=CAM_ASM_000343 /TAXON_ID=268821 /ORGANISM="Scrippsiella Hangoei, Strain SHTV-5" /LENGTH=588 /DNA_ID=CAMNT_0051102091 /DNA_START=6 /DNA_END=1772 /DNA_ORIENTATION=+